MSDQVKFLFDTSFDHGAQEARARPAPQAAPTFTAHDLAAAEQAAFEAGQAAGRAAARSEAEALGAEALAAIASALAGIEQARAADAEQMRREATALAFAIGSKLAPTLMQRIPTAEIEALLKRCLGELREEPRIVVRASEAAIGTLKSRLDAIVAQSGYAGHVVLVPDDMLCGADCRVEWADGGAERDSGRLMARVEAAVQRFLQPAPA